MNPIQQMRTTKGLTVTRNGQHAWTVRDAATGENLGFGNTRESALRMANGRRLRNGSHPAKG